MADTWEEFVNQSQPPKHPTIMDDLRRGIPDRSSAIPVPQFPTSDENRAALYISREALEKANMAIADANVGMNKVKEILTVVEDFLVKYEDLKLKLLDAKIEIEYLKDRIRSLSVWEGQTSVNSSEIITLKSKVERLENAVFPSEAQDL